MDSASSGNPLHETTSEAVRLTREEQFEKAIELFEDTLPRLTGGDLADKRVAAGAFSYYGVCVAMVRRRYAEAVEYCNVSLRSNSLEPEHKANLALVYLERNDRAKAVEILSSALRLDPSNRSLNRLLDEIGRRGKPPIPFLPRSNPLNVWLGKRLRRSNGQG